MMWEQEQEKNLPPIEESAIRFDGDQNSCPQARLLNEAFFKSLGMYTKLPKDLVKMPGLSGKKYRYLINNLVELTEDARYLEVGSFTGSSLCAAMFGNAGKAVAIDNFSERGGSKNILTQNIEQLNKTHENIDVQLMEADFYKVDFSTIGKFNIYFFDGPHEEKDQYAGVQLAQPALDDIYTLVVDDWNGQNVVDGTMNALRDCNNEVLYSINIKTCFEWSFPHITCERSEWHNGYFIAVVKKG